jgi:acetylornithine deacetylase/succinyl-diaminopimelate desuccinylase-like protein
MATAGEAVYPPRMLTAASLSLLLLAPKPALAKPAAAATAAADTVYQDLAVSLLKEYLQIDTTVPPGNELKAATFYKRVLEKEGIEARIDEFAPGRANVIAILKGSGARKPVVLTNHMDVVPADPKRWSVPPFSGLEKDGAIWGRGAQDMKSEGIIQLVAFIRAGREKLALDRDLIFMGTADEEQDFLGAFRAIDQAGFLDIIKPAEYVITEGSDNVIDASGKPVYFGFGAGEKGPYWLTLKTTGTPGHGSRPIADSALNRMIRALEKVRLYKTELKVIPSVAKYFKDLAPQSGDRKAWYEDLATAIKDPKVADVLYADRDVSAMLRNTISITVVHAGYKTNVIPGTAEAELDVRLLPGEDPKAFLDEITKVIGDPTVEITPRPNFRAPNQSPVDTELFRIAEGVFRKNYPGVPVTTKLLSGATECVLFRTIGPNCYGFTTYGATQDESNTTHGDDERISTDQLRKAVPMFYDVIRQLTTKPKK